MRTSVRNADDSPAESSSTQSLVLPCFVNQLVRPVRLECQSEIEVERSIVWWPHGVRKKRAEDRRARGSRRTISIPLSAIPS